MKKRKRVTAWAVVCADGELCWRPHRDRSLSEQDLAMASSLCRLSHHHEIVKLVEQRSKR